MTERKPISAAEFARQLAQDAEYTAGQLERDEQLRIAAAHARASEVPILDELRDVGHDVSSVWDLVNTAVPYPSALPILLRHLQRQSYPGVVMEGMASAMATPASHPYWYELKELYCSIDDARAKEGLAVALAASARKENLKDLEYLASRTENGFTRIHFLRPILRIAGRPSIERFRADSELRREVDSLLQGLCE